MPVNRTVKDSFTLTDGISRRVGVRFIVGDFLLLKDLISIQKLPVEWFIVIEDSLFLEDRIFLIKFPEEQFLEFEDSTFQEDLVLTSKKKYRDINEFDYHRRYQNDVVLDKGKKPNE